MKRIITFTLALLFLLSLTNLEVSAQAPGDPTSVKIGWVSDDEPMIMELDSNHNFELVIKFWVENSRPVPSDMEFETETYESFIVDDPGKITVAANSNETYELTISGNGLNSDGELYSGVSSFDSIVLKGNILLGEQIIGEDEIEKELQFSPVFGFEIAFLSEGKNPVIKSGTDKLIDVNIKPTGNVRDAISKIDMSFRGCPQMDYESSDPLLVTGTVIESQETGRIKLLAPSSHPDKKCKFIVTITSEGNGISYSGELEFDVDAPDVAEKEDEEEESSGTESSDFEVEENSLPTISSLLCLITVLCAAIIRR